MALLFLDSFDHYMTTFVGGIEQKYSSGSGAITAGRHGNGMIPNVTLSLPGVTHQRSIIGAAVKMSTLGLDEIFRLGDVHSLYFRMQVRGDGHVETEILGNDDIRSSAPDVIRAGVWFYVEIATDVSVVIGDPYYFISVDSCQIWVDGRLVLDETALGLTLARTEGTSTHGWNIVGLGGPTNSAVLDDVYVCDGSGAAPHNAPLGDLRIDVLRPNAAGAVTEWTPVGAAANWDAVNDSLPDGDTTHVSAASSPLSDLYELENITTDDTIIGAQLLIMAKRTDEGFAQVAPLLRHGGVTTALPAQPLSSSYFYQTRNVLMTMPNGDPLTDANVNALQAGVRRTL